MMIVLSNISSIILFRFLRIREIFPYLFIIFLIWISRFLLISSLGLYEDDWVFIGGAIDNTFGENLARVNNAIVTFWQGRPLFMIFSTFIPFFAAKLGSLNALYLIGFLILSSNACLFYSLLKKISSQPYIPIIATLFFCLYPADTTFNYLLHLFELQISLLFLLLAFHFYVNSQRYVNSQKILNFGKILSYVMAIFSLLTYESPFLSFCTAPFLLKDKTKKQIINHFLVLFFILIVYFILRKLAQEKTVIELGETSIIQKLIYQTFVGPIISLGTFFIRPLEILRQFKFENLLILLIALPIFYLVINYFINNQKGRAIIQNSEKYLKTSYIFVAGVIMTILAYPSALTLSVNIIDGRGSRVHFAAILGTTLILSCFWNSFIMRSNSQKPFKKLSILLLALHLSFLFVFCINVQRLYKLSWQYQQAFWSDVIELSPDLEDSTVLLVQSPSLSWGKQINPFDWSMPSVLSSIYDFPKDWKFAPRLYILNSNINNIEGWKSMIDKNNEFLMSNKNGSLRYYYDWEPERKVSGRNIILLVEESGRLARKTFLKSTNGNIVLLKQMNKEINSPTYPKSIVFHRLIYNIDRESSENQSAIYLKDQEL